MKVFTVSLFIFLLVLAVSILVGFSDFASMKKSTPMLNTEPSNTLEELPQNTPSGLRIIVESSN